MPSSSVGDKNFSLHAGFEPGFLKSDRFPGGESRTEGPIAATEAAAERPILVIAVAAATAGAPEPGASGASVRFDQSNWIGASPPGAPGTLTVMKTKHRFGPASSIEKSPISRPLWEFHPIQRKSPVTIASSTSGSVRASFSS